MIFSKYYKRKNKMKSIKFIGLRKQRQLYNCLVRLLITAQKINNELNNNIKINYINLWIPQLNILEKKLKF